MFTKMRFLLLNQKNAKPKVPVCDICVSPSNADKNKTKTLNKINKTKMPLDID